jgi:diacylglycerol kinase (ATP)
MQMKYRSVRIWPVFSVSIPLRCVIIKHPFQLKMQDLVRFAYRAGYLLIFNIWEEVYVLQPKKAAVVVNPASANGRTGKRWPEIASSLQNEGYHIDYTFTVAPGHASTITSRYLEEGHDLVISVGGDGTANEVVNGFFSSGKIIRDSAAVAFLSTGTGRDLGRTIGSPKDIGDAVRHIDKSPLRPVDVGRVSYMSNRDQPDVRYFINVAGLGLDGDTVARVNRTSKAFGGFISFLWGTVVSLVLYQNQTMAITVDGDLICDEPVTVVVIGNGCYFGGGMQIAPNAVIDDGLFDIIILRNLSKLELLANLPKVYGGTHLSHPRITSLRGKKVSVSSTGTALLDLDGEQPGRAPAEIELLPGALLLKG